MIKNKNNMNIEAFCIENCYNLKRYDERNLKFRAFSKENFVSTKIVTDGTILQGELWIDKDPSFFDSDFKKGISLYRLDLQMEEMDFFLVEKRFLEANHVIKDLYISSTFLGDISERLQLSLLEVTVFGNGKLKIRKV